MYAVIYMTFFLLLVWDLVYCFSIILGAVLVSFESFFKNKGMYTYDFLSIGLLSKYPIDF
jgi:hypothetical protein